MKRIFGGLTVILIVGMLLAGCANPLSQGEGAARGAVAYVPTAADKEVAVFINDSRTLNTTRKNASGDKITSNEHSADFPGLYFYWDDKQKEDGLLMVEAEYFDHFTEFTLTMKLSNEYWDWTVALQSGQKQTPDGYYTFKIARDTLPKNINMVFLDGWKETRNTYYKEKEDPEPVIEDGIISFTKAVKNVLGGPAAFLSEEEIALISFDIFDNAELEGEPLVSGLKLVDGKVYYKGPEIITGNVYYIRENLNGLEDVYYPLSQGLAVSTTDKVNFTITSGNSIPLATEVDPTNSWFIGDQHIKELWSFNLQWGADAALFGAMMDIKAKDGTEPTWIWTRPDSWETGEKGDEIMISVSEFNIPNGFSWADNVPFYFACDNAAVVYVNNKWVGCTYESFGKNVGEGTSSYNFGTLDHSEFDGSIPAWAHVYMVNIAGALKEGANSIKIYAANSAQADDGFNDGYNTDNNPAGLIFSCSFDAVGSDAEFVNEVREYYGFPAAIHTKAWVLDDKGKGKFDSATVWDGNGSKKTKQGNWFTYFNLAGLSTRTPVEYEFVNGDKLNVAPGKVTFSVEVVIVKGVPELQLVVTVTGTSLSDHFNLALGSNAPNVSAPGNYPISFSIPNPAADGSYTFRISKAQFDLAKYISE